MHVVFNPVVPTYYSGRSSGYKSSPTAHVVESPPRFSRISLEWSDFNFHDPFATSPVWIGRSEERWSHV